MASATTDRRQGLTGDKGFKAPIQAATTANIVLSGEQTIDGVAVHANGINGYPDRVLVWNQSNPIDNGIWDVSTASWTRSQDANGTQDLVTGTMGLVTGGVTYANQQWILTTAGIISPGSTALVFQIGIPSLPVLAASSGAGIIGWIQSGIGAVFRWVQDKLRESVSAKDFGALNDGLTASAGLNRTAIQAAIDAMNLRGGGEVLIGGGGVYYVDLTNYLRDSGAVYGVTSIKMKDNVAVKIEPGTTIRLIPSAYGPGAYYRMFSSRDATRLSNAKIYGGGTIDGNIANQIVNADNNASNIQLECADNVRVEGIRSINAKGMGIQVRGAIGTNATRLFVLNNYVDNCINIGIQASSFSGLVISGNHVTNCTNNGIDLYGEDGTTTCQSKKFVVVGNTVDAVLTGVFCETVRNGVVSGNSLVQCNWGAIINRINGQPRGIKITGNSFLTCPTGIRVTGDTGGVSIANNIITDFSTAGVALGTGATGNVSYVDVSNNTFVPVNNTTGIITLAGAVASFNTGRDNIVVSAGIALAYLNPNTAGSSVVNSIGGFRVLPAQVGPDTYGEAAQFTQLALQNGKLVNGAGPSTVTIPDNTAGTVKINAYQGGVGRSRRVVPYMKYGGTLVLGTQVVDPIVTATATSACTVVANQLQINYVAGANNYAQWGLELTAQD